MRRGEFDCEFLEKKEVYVSQGRDYRKGPNPDVLEA